MAVSPIGNLGVEAAQERPARSGRSQARDGNDLMFSLVADSAETVQSADLVERPHVRLRPPDQSSRDEEIEHGRETVGLQTSSWAEAGDLGLLIGPGAAAQPFRGQDPMSCAPQGGAGPVATARAPRELLSSQAPVTAAAQESTDGSPVPDDVFAGSEFQVRPSFPFVRNGRAEAVASGERASGARTPRIGAVELESHRGLGDAFGDLTRLLDRAKGAGSATLRLPPDRMPEPSAQRIEEDGVAQLSLPSELAVQDVAALVDAGKGSAMPNVVSPFARVLSSLLNDLALVAPHLSEMPSPSHHINPQVAPTTRVLTLELVPASLGSVTVRLAFGSAGLKVGIEAATEQGARALERDSAALVGALADAGFVVNDVAISHASASPISTSQGAVSEGSSHGARFQGSLGAGDGGGGRQSSGRHENSVVNPGAALVSTDEKFASDHGRSAIASRFRAM